MRILRLILWAVIAGLLLVCIGVAIGYFVWGSSSTTKTEDFAPAIEQADGSKVLSREPDGKADTKKPTVPKGHTITRTVEVTVAGGKPVAPAQGCVTIDDLTCPPVTVRVDLLRAPDGTYRALASSSDGQVLDGVDIPRDDAVVLARRPWTAGYERGTDGRAGGFVQRDFGRLSVGVSVTDGGSGLEATGRIGFRF